MGKRLASQTMISSLIKEKKNHAGYIPHFIGVSTGKFEKFSTSAHDFHLIFKVVVTWNRSKNGFIAYTAYQNAFDFKHFDCFAAKIVVFM